MAFHLITEYSAALLGISSFLACFWVAWKPEVAWRGVINSPPPQLFPHKKTSSTEHPYERRIPHPKQKTFSFNTFQPFSISISPHTKFHIIGLSKRSQRFGQGTRQSCLVEPTGKGIPWNLQSFCLMLIHFGLVIGNSEISYTFTNVFTCPKHQKIPEQRGAVSLYSKYEYITLLDDRRSKSIPSTNKAPRSGCFAIPTSSALLLLKGLPQWLSQ